MTLPDERLRSLVQTKQFLLDLLDARKTPRVPKHIRQHAYRLLRHWPDNYHLDSMANRMPDMFAKQLDPLHRLLLVYQQDSHEE